MRHSIQITNFDPQPAQSFFEMDDRKLALRHACRRIADAKPGHPCRVSLQDAGVGDELIVFHYPHHDVASPHRASGPVFVRKNARAAQLAINELPGHLGHCQLALREYDENSMPVAAQTARAANWARPFNNCRMNSRCVTSMCTMQRKGVVIARSTG